MFLFVNSKNEQSEIIFNDQSDDRGTKQYAQKIVC